MATYYWVGGTGTWDGSSTTHWSASSGGGGGAGFPSATDNVIFDSASGTGKCTTAAGAACKAWTFNSSTLTFELGANLTAADICTLTAGSIDLKSYTFTVLSFASNNTNTRSINFGTGKISCASNAVTLWNTATITNLTFSGTPLFEATYSGATGTRSINSGAMPEGQALSVNVTAGTDIILLTSDTAQTNLNFTGFSGTLTNARLNLYGNLTLSTGMTYGAGASTLTFKGTTGTQAITSNGKTIDAPVTFSGTGTYQLQDNMTIGSTRTVTLTTGTIDVNGKTLSGGLFTSNNTNTRGLSFGTGQINVTGSGGVVWQFSGVSGLTVSGTPVVNFTYSGSTGTRTIRHGGTQSFPSAQAISFNITAGSDATSVAVGAIDFNMTGYTGAYTNAICTVYGNLTFGTGMTTASNAFALVMAAASGTKIVTTNGVTVNFPITIDCTGATISFADALNSASTFTMANGTVKLKASATSTVGTFVTSGSTQKYLQSTLAGSQATLSQASGTVTVSYLSIKDIAATGGATWNAYVDYNNVDQGDNTGWDFSYSPAIDNEFPIALRSFTQPKRF